MSAIKYRVRARGDWDFRDFDTVRLEISVGQSYHEGSKLEATVNWARSNFEKQVIILGDTIQRYNIAFQERSNLNQAFEKAAKLGCEWIDRNKDLIQGIEVRPWEKWRSHPDYLDEKAHIASLYAENEEFRSNLQEAINSFYSRRRGEIEDYQAFFKNSEDYLLEESAVLSMAYNEIGGISAYPGEYLAIWNMFAGKNSVGIPEGLKHGYTTRLSFERKLQAA